MHRLWQLANDVTLDVFFFYMAVVAPLGVVATALGLRTLPYWNRRGSASDTRPHRAVPVYGAHRARSLTCILTTDNDAALAHSSAQCSTHTTNYRHEQRGTYGGYINGPVCVVGSTLAVPYSGTAARPGAPRGLTFCSAEASAEQFLWYNGGFVNFAPQRDEVFDRDRRSSSIHNFT